jgi:hypothetical protein
MPRVETPIGLGKGRRTGLLGVAQMPDHAAMDNHGQVDFVGQTVAMFFIGEDIGGQGQTTPRQHRHQPLMAQGTDQAIYRHRGDMADDCTELQTEPAMRRQQSLAGDLRGQRAIAQDEVGEDREHGSTCGALDAPDGDATETDTEVMRVTRQAPSAATGRLVFQLEAHGQDEGEDTFEKRLAIAKQVKVGRFMLKIDGDGTVFSWWFGLASHGSPPGLRWSAPAQDIPCG